MEELDKFPKYDELKKLNKNYEYEYNFPEIIGTGYLRFTYNEDLRGDISLDYLENNFLTSIYLKDFELNTFYKLNKKNYDLIIKAINDVINQIINNLNEYKKLI